MAKIVIIGGGIVGLALAVRASSKGHTVVLVEAGGILPGDSLLDTSGALARPDSYYDLAATRVSALSGSNWVWGGNSRWLEQSDFSPLDTSAPSWLIDRAALEPYFRDVEKLLLISGTWDVARYFGISPPDGPFYRGDLYKLSPMVANHGGRRRGVFHEVWQTQLASVEVLTKHLFVGLLTRGSRVTGIECLLGEKIIQIDGDYFFLAAGGIENSRQLLLLAASSGAHALRHVSANIGTYWSEHPHPYFGPLLFADGLFRTLAGAPAPQGVDFVSVVKYSLVDKTRLPGPALAHTFQPVDKRGQRYLASINEQLPLRGNRLTLSSGARDKSGRPLAVLHYGVDPVTRERIWSAMLLFAAYLGAHERTRLRLAISETSFKSTDAFIGGGHHHMGGTCMGRLEVGGVVDADCRVYGLDNLALAGSSVFPRGGAVNPTINAIALAFHALERMDR